MLNSVLAWAAMAIVPFLGSAEELNKSEEAKKDATPGPRMLAHDVFFTLKDDSAKAKKELVAGCKKYLSDQPGTVAMAAGMRVEELDREVNDRLFDVALHIVFKDKAAHDAYQEAEKHKKFIEEFKGNWKSVRVFDSWVDVAVHGDTQEDQKAEKLYLPDPALHFAGMIRGKVVSKGKHRFVLAVEDVTKVWKTNKAKDPKSLVGKKVTVVGPKTRGRRLQPVGRFIDRVKVGQQVTIDVAHRDKAEVLTILELTAEQRQRL